MYNFSKFGVRVNFSAEVQDLKRKRKEEEKREKKKRRVLRLRDNRPYEDFQSFEFPVSSVLIWRSFDALKGREKKEKKGGKKSRRRKKKKKNRDPSIDRENREAVFGGSSHARSERVVGRWALVNSK